jgi:hypothetical protein
VPVSQERTAILAWLIRQPSASEIIQWPFQYRHCSIVQRRNLNLWL